MNIKDQIQNKPTALIVGGLCAGFANGLLGAGGGIIIVWILSGILGGHADGKDIFACAISVMLPISAVSTVGYAISGGLPSSGTLPILLPAILGGIAGGFLLDRIDTHSVQILFAVLITLSGILMVIGR